MYESINEYLKNSFYHNQTIQEQLQVAEKAVLQGQKTSFIAAADLLNIYFDELKR